MADSKTDWDAVEKDEGWTPVTLKDVIGEGVPEERIQELLQKKGYFLLDNGKWQSPDANTVISDYQSGASQQEEKKSSLFKTLQGISAKRAAANKL